ncbi:substrate-binding and VWA domain-containing protein [Streptomyces sp. NBC_01218]|uniref:VWA domain-containing protein n=1 Tax=unclassified Streptomyces TaxID=2593676 RepID=UPI0023B90825|nr:MULTISPECIES: VWA domain-containing protein [unclassified Streptomyces]WEH42933.1 substrate-binding domain-containing protein [Streptomyces sp. AM 2-1-1]WSQ54569.1 substrate-binding and VWA domain-containing protein [Streptomyces sp. NBC_01218]
MGRHSLPDRSPAGRPGEASAPNRRRTVVLATALVVVVTAGTAAVARTGLLSFSEPCGSDAVRLTVAASPDIAPAVRAVADRARADEVRTDGRCMDVEVVAADSYKVANTVAAGGKTPYQVWLPDSDLWLDRAKGSGDGIPLTPGDSVATSPVAFAVVPSAAKAMGWPQKQLSWAELVAAALESGGAVRLGAADPARSATGLLALAAIGASSAGQGGDGDTRAARTAKILSERMSESDPQAAGTLAHDDAGAEQGDAERNQALMLSEQAAFAHNAKATGSGKVDLFYPKDGAPQLNYPYTLVDETSMTVEQSRTALRLMTLLRDSGSGGADTSLPDHGFRPPDGAAVPGIVRAAGGKAPQPYTDAPAAAPTATELQEVLGMWTITVQSARLSTVVDASGSMATPVPGSGESRMDVTKQSLLQALSQFTDDDEIGLWEFATTLDGTKDYRELTPTGRLGDRTASGSTHREELAAAFDELQPVPDGATGLYDTTLAAYRAAVTSYVPGKFNALVILTDGSNQDDHGISRTGLVQQLKGLVDPERPVPILAIAVGPDADREEVAEIAKVTGGGGYEVSDPAEIQTVILQAIMTASQTSTPE